MLNIDLKRVLVLDVETVSQYKHYDDLPDDVRELWNRKAMQLSREGEPPSAMYDRAGIYAEFGKIVCISTGIYVKRNTGGYGFRVKSFYGDNERSLLLDFIDLFKNGPFSQSSVMLCAHNGKEFDFPYICRRLIINGLEIPPVLQIAGKKPWEVGHLDTMELWKFGDYKSFTSLNLLANCLNIPTPKDDIDGSMVGKVFWEEGNLKRIKTYCEKDVITTARILLRFCGKPDIIESDIECINNGEIN